MRDRGYTLVKNIFNWSQIVGKPKIFQQIEVLTSKARGFFFVQSGGFSVRSIEESDIPELAITKIANLQQELQSRPLDSSVKEKYQPKGEYEPADSSIQSHLSSYHPRLRDEITQRLQEERPTKFIPFQESSYPNEVASFLLESIHRTTGIFNVTEVVQLHVSDAARYRIPLQNNIDIQKI